MYNSPKNRLLHDKQDCNFQSISEKCDIKTIRKRIDSITDLHTLHQVVSSFDGLDIKRGAKNLVFGDGNPKANLMLIGEAPGEEEDIKGIPFCGRSGKLLKNILLSVGIEHKDYYITNTIFWRPPANRKPTDTEIEMCKPFVEKHISLIKPKVLLMVGATAAESFLNLKDPMKYLRKQEFTYQNQYTDNPIRAFVIFHPSYLLRQPRQKKNMYFDMLKIKDKWKQ